MPKKGDQTPPSFLSPEQIREILQKGNESLLLSADNIVIEKAAQLIESMKEDLVKIMNMPLKDIEIFRSMEHLTLKEIESFYSMLEQELKKQSSK